MAIVALNNLHICTMIIVPLRTLHIGTLTTLPLDTLHACTMTIVFLDTFYILAMHATLTARDFFNANVYLPGPFTCIFSKTSPELWLTPGPVTQTKIGQTARRYRRLMQVLVLSARGIEIGSKTCVLVFPGWHFEIVSTVLIFRDSLVCFIKYSMLCCIDFFVKCFNIELVFNKKRLLWFNDL